MTPMRSNRKLELFIPALGILSLLTTCLIVCLKKYFLDDEFISFLLVNDPSLSHMIGALADQVDVSPPFYFVLGWFWVRVAGASEFSLRVFSSLGVGFAFLIAWMVIHRYFRFWPTSLGVTASFFLSLLIYKHGPQARFYGLFMTLGAIAFFMYDRITRKGLTCSWGDFLNNTVAHSCLVLTHNFGLLYSGVYLLAYVLFSIYKKVFTPKVYLSVILGWVTFLPWVGSFLHQAEIGMPHSWIPKPDYGDLLFAFFPGIPIGIFLIMLFSAWFLVFRKKGFRDNGVNEDTVPGPVSSSVPLLILGVLLIAFPPLPVWIISRQYISVFANKYMILNTLGWSILLSWLSQKALYNVEGPIHGETWKNLFLGNHKKLFTSLLLCLLFLFPVCISLMRTNQPRPGIMEERLGGNLPIAVESWDEYMGRFLYSPQKTRYYYILDWGASLEKESSLNAVDNYLSMAAIKRQYHFSNIIQSTDFLKKYDQLLVLRDKRNRWFDLRIKNNPDFNVTLIKDDLILVSRKR